MLQTGRGRRGDRAFQPGRHEGDRRAGILQRIGEFVRMQLGIDRDGGRAGPPDRVQGGDIVGLVLGDDRDAVARPDAETGKAAGQPRGRLGQLPLGRHHARAVDDRRQRRIGASRAGEPSRNVHGPSPPAAVQ